VFCLLPGPTHFGIAKLCRIRFVYLLYVLVENRLGANFRKSYRHGGFCHPLGPLQFGSPDPPYRCDLRFWTFFFEVEFFEIFINRTGTVCFALCRDRRILAPRNCAVFRLFIFCMFWLKIAWAKIFANRTGTVDFAVRWDRRSLAARIGHTVAICAFGHFF